MSKAETGTNTPTEDKAPDVKTVTGPGFKLAANDADATAPAQDNDAIAATIAANLDRAATEQAENDVDSRTDAQGRIEPTLNRDWIPHEEAAAQINAVLKAQEEAHQKALAEIAKFFARDEVLLKEYLPVLLTAQVADGLSLKGTDNEYTLCKDLIQAEKGQITARAAFELGILALNNSAFVETGVDLTGSTRDRYVLTLAANHLGLKVTNPVSEADLPDDLKAECAALKAEWEAVLKDPLNELAFKAIDEKIEKAQTSADVAEEAAEETPAQDQPVDAEEQIVAEGQDRLREILAETPENTASADKPANAILEGLTPIDGEGGSVDGPLSIDVAAAESQAQPTPSVLKDGDQPLYTKAVRLVTETQTVSNAYLQRNLHVGFNRAARILSELENQGVVSAVNENGKRDVLAEKKPHYKLTAEGPVLASGPN